MRYRLKDLVEIPRLQELTDHLYAAAGIPSAIIASDGEILTGSGWQRICTDFHRRHPDIARQCIESDFAIRERLEAGDPFVVYTCPQGLTDASVPIVIDGEHLANAFVGQLFTKSPDAAVEARFRENAREFGLDEDVYIKAFREIPVIGPEKFRPALLFLAHLARMVAELGLQRKREIETTDRLRRSEERAESILAALPDLMFRISREGVHLDFHAPDSDRLYLRPDEFLGKNVRETLPAKVADAFMANVGAVLERGESRSFEYELTFGGDDVRSFEARMVRAGDDEALVIVREITARVRAEAALRESESRFRTLADAGRVLIWTSGLDKKCDYFNQTWMRFTGRTLDQELGDGWADGVHPEDLERCVGTYVSLFDRRQPFSMEYRLRNARGEYRWILDDGTPRYDSNGRFLGYIGHCMDIHDRKVAEKSLLESEALLRQAQEAAQLGHYVFDVGTGQWTCSEALDTVFGIAADHRKTIEGWLDIVHPDDREMMAVYFRDEVLGNRQRFDKIYRIVRKSDGSTHWVRGEGDLSFNSAGTPATMFGIIRNVTRDVEADRRAERLQDQLQQAIKLEAVGRLAGGVAHDFNNLLTIIGGNADLLMSDSPPGTPVPDELSEIKKAAERAASLTAQLLAFSRKQMMAPRVVDINELVAGSTRMLKRLIGEDIELFFAPCAESGKVKVDPHQMEQVFVNLAVNARDAMPRGGVLRVETGVATVDDDYASSHLDAAPGTYVRLGVADTGIGIGPEILPHVFEPFFTTKGQGSGTGLGLSMVYGVVRQNGGFVEVESELGVGTTFRVYLPLVAEEGAASPSAELKRPLGSESILLVEDEDPVRTLARKFLERLGYRVVDFRRPADALEWVRVGEGRFDLLLTDVIMPEMNGRQLHDALSALRPDLPVLFMSGYTGDTIARHGVLEEGTDFLQKPFTLDQLAHALRDALAAR
ncbi:MAG: PocR ligand-binding domain-containing protein [Deltaproteobacteria bacterium]|nr:PocR ligand-binding domain-containing protein [Deltaproteobacteria bacterium]